MKNILVNNEPILRAVEICRKGNFSMNILFQDEISMKQKQDIWSFLGDYVRLRPIEYADLVLEYCAPDADSIVRSYKNAEVDFSYLYEIRRERYEKVSNELDSSGTSLLRTAYDRLGYEPRDAEIVLDVARCVAYMSGSDKILIEHLAESIHYRSFDRNLIVKDKRSWTADQLQEILSLMTFKDENADSHFCKPFDDLGPVGQGQWEGIMWGWQDAVKKIRLLLNLEPTEKLEIKNPPSKSDWYICYVDGEKIPLKYNTQNNFWCGVDGKIYHPKSVIWTNE